MTSRSISASAKCLVPYPLLNRLLGRLELGARLRHAFDAKPIPTWTPGTVVLLVVAIWLAALFLLSLKINSPILACSCRPGACRGAHRVPPS